jgi:hypothetical protein
LFGPLLLENITCWENIDCFAQVWYSLVVGGVMMKIYAKAHKGHKLVSSFLVLIMILSLVNFHVIAETTDNTLYFTHNSFAWGMKKDRIINIIMIIKNPDEQSDNSITYNKVVTRDEAIKKAKVTYYFDESNSLISYVFEDMEDHPNDTEYYNDYLALNKFLGKGYRGPFSEKNDGDSKYYYARPGDEKTLTYEEGVLYQALYCNDFTDAILSFDKHDNKCRIRILYQPLQPKEEQKLIHGVTLGMSGREIIIRERGTFDRSSIFSLDFNNSVVFDRKAETSYILDSEDRLTSIYVYFTENLLFGDRYLSEFHELEKTLKELYGDPYKEIVQWNNDTFKNDSSLHGFALSLGDVEYHTIFHSDDIYIELSLGRADFKVKLKLFYMRYNK